MTRFVEIPRDAAKAQLVRAALLAKPPEFFQQYCHGRVPDLLEKMHFIERMIQSAAAPKSYANDIYTVQVRNEPPYVHLTISGLDGEPCKNWSHFQRIKNELVGSECEAVELFPADSRLVDTRNEYHLWVLADPASRYPFGFTERRVWDKPLTFPEELTS
jgi:hypothetical protein